MTGPLYLVDNNALSRLTPAQRVSDFFRANCRISRDVRYEARGYVEGEVDDVELPTTPAVLRRLVEVMATVRSGDTTLVDLYANKGAADPVIIAIALEKQAAEDATLLPNKWVIVTDDKAVSSTSRKFGLLVMGFKEFQGLFPN